MATKKGADGRDYPSSAFLYVPDSSKPTTWKLRVKEYVGGAMKVTINMVSKAAQAVGPSGFRGQKVQLPGGVISRMKSRLRSLYRSLGVAPDKIPSHLKEAADGNPIGSLITEGMIDDIFEGTCAVDSERVVIDEEGGMLKNVVMCGLTSKNGRRYKPEVLRDAINRGVYEGKPFFFDHDSDRKGTRRVRDLGGEWINTRFDEETQRPRGDIKILPKFRQDVFDIARTTPRQVAPSHVVEGKTRRVKENGTVFEDVEYISKGHSIDLVVGAATINSLTEGDETKMKIDIEELTIDQLREHRSDLVEILSTEPTDNSNPKLKEILETVKELKAENATLKEAREKDAKIAEAREVLKAALNESALSEQVQSDIMESHKDTILDAEAAKVLVKQYVDLVEKQIGKPLVKNPVKIPATQGITNKRTEGTITLAEAMKKKTGLIKEETKKD